MYLPGRWPSAATALCFVLVLSSSVYLQNYGVFLPSESVTKFVKTTHSNYTIYRNHNKTNNASSTRSTPATVTTSPAPEKTKPTLEEQIAAFYENHSAKMKELVNRSSTLRWSDGGPFKSLAAEFDGLYVTIEIDQKGKPVTNLHDIPNLHDYGFAYLEHGSLCQMAKVFDAFRNGQSTNSTTNSTSWPHVALVRFNPDFGALSSTVRGHTANYFMGPNFWQNEGCTREFVLNYINHPDTLAIFTSQFQVMRHEKIISVPLGLPRFSADSLERFLQYYIGQPPTQQQNRTELLMLNGRPWQQRNTFIKQILKNFNATDDIINASIAEKLAPLTVENVTAMMTLPATSNDNSSSSQQLVLRNTYQVYNALQVGDAHKSLMYYQQLVRSKFIWSPAGLGFDCFRTWEALYMGTIPIMAHLNRLDEDGWLSETLRDLPVLLVEQHEQITPEFLEQAYIKIVTEAPPGGYKYEKLTKQYWVDMAYSFLPEKYRMKRKNAQQPQQR